MKDTPAAQVNAQIPQPDLLSSLPHAHLCALCKFRGGAAHGKRSGYAEQDGSMGLRRGDGLRVRFDIDDWQRLEPRKWVAYSCPVTR